MEESKTIVKGKRICAQCRGICHEGSFRNKYRYRSTYFCSANCLRYYLDDRLAKRLARRYNLPIYSEIVAKYAQYTDEQFADFLELYDAVDVITR